MHVRMANRRAGGIASSDFAPKVDAYDVLAASTSGGTLMMNSPGSCNAGRRRHARTLNANGLTETAETAAPGRAGSWVGGLCCVHAAP